MENEREDLSFTTLGNAGGSSEGHYITVPSVRIYIQFRFTLWKKLFFFNTKLFFVGLLKDRRSSQDDDDEHDGDGIETGELREQDRFLPIANVARIMKKAIPTQVISNYFYLKYFSYFFNFSKKIK